MSHQYVASLQYTRQCIDILNDSKNEIRDALNNLRNIVKNSSKSMDDSLNRMYSDIEKECSQRIIEINHEIGQLNVAVDTRVVERTKSFVSEMNRVRFKIYSFDKAIADSLQVSLNRTMPREGLDEYLSGISDEKLKLFISLLSKNKVHSSMSFEELREMAECQIDPNKKVGRKVSEMVAKEVAKQLHVNVPMTMDIGLENKNGVASPMDIIKTTTEEIIDERLRKSAIQAIVKSITDKGFVVEKKNIRMIRETNTVKITALKPGNQRAEFSVDLDGRFAYRFDGYEGHACEKDIEPFENDLERIYGISIKNKITVWDNPDKLTKSHYAEMKTRRDN